MKIGDLVECPRLGTGAFRIVSETHDSFVLEQNGKKSPIFKVHCHQSFDLRRRSMKERFERSEKIGRKNNTSKLTGGYYD